MSVKKLFRLLMPILFLTSCRAVDDGGAQTKSDDEKLNGQMLTVVCEFSRLDWATRRTSDGTFALFLTGPTAPGVKVVDYKLSLADFASWQPTTASVESYTWNATSEKWEDHKWKHDISAAEGASTYVDSETGGQKVAIAFQEAILSPPWLNGDKTVSIKAEVTKLVDLASYPLRLTHLFCEVRETYRPHEPFIGG